MSAVGGGGIKEELKMFDIEMLSAVFGPTKGK
jgi:hypothetical protein